MSAVVEKYEMNIKSPFLRMCKLFKFYLIKKVLHLLEKVLQKSSNFTFCK